MTIETVRTVIAKFLGSADPAVLVIKGAWGTGKTHTWNAVLKANKHKASLPTYAYVSLFGMKSISDLRIAIVAKSILMSDVGQKLDLKQSIKGTGERIKRQLKRGLVLSSYLKGAVPYLQDITIPFDSIAGHLLGESIICLDDWERTNLDPQELLGWISELRVEKGCKVALIFNDDKLDEGQKNIYRRYREKLIDIELKFAPTAKEAIEIAIPSEARWADLIGSALLRLDLNNVRLIHKMLAMIRVLEPYIERAHSNIQEQVIQTAILFTWSHYGEDSPRKPPVDFVRGWNRISSVMTHHKEKADPEHQPWAAALSAYGYSSSDELDLAVDEVIHRGFVDGGTLVSEIAAREHQLASIEKENAFTKAWDLFHRSFRDNETEVVDGLIHGLREAVMIISPSNLNGTIILLRNFRPGEFVDQLVDDYIEKRKGEETLFDVNEVILGHQGIDPYVRKRFEEKMAAMVKLPSLREAVVAAVQNNGWSPQADLVMKGATVEELQQSLLDDDGRRFFNGCQFMSTVNGWEDFRDKFNEALTRIASSSKINAYRLARFGIRQTTGKNEPDASNDGNGS